MEPEIIRSDTPLAILLRNHTRIVLLQFLLVAQIAQADEGRNLVYLITPLTSWIIIFFFRRLFNHEFLYIQFMAKQTAVITTVKGLAYSN